MSSSIEINTREGEPDMEKELSFEAFRKAVEVFRDDYGIVHHPELEKRSPFDEPNKAGIYSLTQIPEDMTEDEFLTKLAEVTDICVTCMDKDCAHSTWSKLQSGENKVAMFTWGGGVVQHTEPRTKALNTIMSYIASKAKEGRLSNLKTIHLDDHDSSCGAVTHFSGGVSVAEVLTQHLGREITPHSPEENSVMAELIRGGALLLRGVFDGTNVRITSELHYTDRIAGEEGSRLVEIDLSPTLPLMNMAMYLKFYDSAIKALIE